MPKKISITDLIQFNRRNEIYHSVLRFGSNCPGNFGLTELGNWLLVNYSGFVDEFRSSHTSKSYRLTKKRTLIRNRINDLMELRLIEYKGTVKSKKNETQTTRYSLSSYGNIIWNLIEFMNSSQEYQAIFIAKLFDSVLLHLKKRMSSMDIFFIKFFENCKKEGILSQLRIEVRHFVENTTIDKILRVLELYFIHNHYARELTGKIFVTTLDELDPETRRLVLFQLKLNIESEYELNPVTREWELMRFGNIQEYSNLTLLNTCNKCGTKYSFQMDFLQFFTLPIKLMNDSNKQSLDLARIPCRKCGTKNMLEIVPFWMSLNDPAL